MADRNRNRRGRDPQNDWDWYYYEYRYTPYSPYLQNDYNRERDMDRDYDRDIYYYNAPYGYNRNYPRDYDEYYYPGGYGNMNQGRYSGYGPRGYRRSDDRIEEDVNDRLTWHSQLDATDIKVAVQDGVVTLTGTVDSRQDKRLAENVAESVPGVWDVNNQIHVRNKGYYRGWQAGVNRNDIREGMDVFGSDDQRIGQVKEIRSNDFLVDRPMARDVYVPFSDCQISNGQVRLDVPSTEVDNQGWLMPEMTDSQRSQQKKR